MVLYVCLDLAAWLPLLLFCLGMAFPLLSGLIFGDVALEMWTGNLRALLPIHSVPPIWLVVGEGRSPTPTRKASISGKG